MNILLITFDPPQNVGGIEGRSKNYSKKLSDLGHSVEIISITPGGKFERGDIEGVPTVSLPSAGRKLLKILRFTTKEISKRSVDSIFLVSGALTIYGVLLLTYARLKGIRDLSLFYGKDILVARASRLSSIILWFAPRLAKKIVVNSHYTGRLIPSRFEKKIAILYPSIDPEIANNIKVREAPEGRVVLFVGRLVARKGVDDLIRAINKVGERVPNCVLEIVGDGPERASLEKLSRDLKITDRVHFLGTLSGSSLYERYASCSVFVMPSKTTKTDVEGFGTVFLEAALFEKPSIGTRSGGIPEAILDNETGILVQESDIPSLASAIEALLGDASFGSKLGRKGRTRVLSQFTWEKSTELVASLLSQV